jgi:signal transduction histidine kinase
MLDVVALKHVDPSQEPVFLETARAIATQRETLPRLAVNTRQSLLVPEVTPASLKRFAVNPVEAAVVTRLGIRTAMAIPLVVAGKALGAMTFLASGRGYDTDDLALAEHVGARVASALENARLYEVAREAIRARDDLLLLTAHELRTPLTTLQLMTQSLQRRVQRGVDTNDATRIDDIARQVQRFDSIVGRVLDALSIRTEGVQLQPGPCDLAALVADRVRFVERRAERAGSPIRVEGPPSIVGTWDRARLGSAIDVLLDNAIKFGGGKPITVTLGTDGPALELSIHDEGIGIPADRMSCIFQPFERAVPKEHFGGLGLGLYIARAIVDAHGGSIDVTSQPGHGSTFAVRLPR